MDLDPIVVAAHTDIMGSVVDSHRLRGESGVFHSIHEPILRSGGVQVVCDHLGGDSRYGYTPATGLDTSALQRALRLFDHAHRESEETDNLVIAECVADIRNAASSGKIAMILGMEGGTPLQGELPYLRAFYRLGLRSLGITHNWRNQLADGCLERSRGGFTHFGQAVVRECNRLGIVVDLSHMGREGVEDALNLTDKPLIASHTNPFTIRAHPHNLPDELLRGIASTGGFIGIFALNSYLSDKERPTISDVTGALGHLIDTVGIEHAAIAPDIMENWDQAQFKSVTEGSSTFASVPTTPIEYEYPEGFSSLAHLPNLREAARMDLRLSEDELDLVFGMNCIRAYGEAWGDAPKVPSEHAPAIA